MTDDLDLAEILRQKGWTCIPPDPESGMPVPIAGQVWTSRRNPKIAPRTVTKIGPHLSRPSSEACVFYLLPGDDPTTMRRPRVMCPRSWKSWVKNADARPALMETVSVG